MTSFEERMKNIRRDKELEREREREKGVRNPFFEGSEACLHCDVWWRAKERDHVFRWELAALEIARLPLKLARRRTIGLITGHLSADLALPFSLFLSSSPRAGTSPGQLVFKGLFFHLKRPRYIVADSKRSRGALFSPHLLEELGGYNIIFRRVK